MAALTPSLGDRDLFVREAAAQALGTLGSQGSVEPLESRKRVEAEGRVLTAIDDALAAIRAGSH